MTERLISTFVHKNHNWSKYILDIFVSIQVMEEKMQFQVHLSLSELALELENHNGPGCIIMNIALH